MPRREPAQCPRRPESQCGAVTAEVAVALPSLILLLALLLGAATAGLTQLRLEEAARAGAREVVRGEPADQVEATVRRLAGPQSRLEVAEQGVWTTVTVGSSVSLPGMDFLGWDLSASATARAELQEQAPRTPDPVASVAGNDSTARPFGTACPPGPACSPGPGSRPDPGSRRGGCPATPCQVPAVHA